MNKILTILIDALILFAVSTVFVYLADLGFSGLKKKVPKDNPVVTAIVQGEIKNLEEAINMKADNTGNQAPQDGGNLLVRTDDQGRTALMRAAFVNLRKIKEEDKEVAKAVQDDRSLTLRLAKDFDDLKTDNDKIKKEAKGIANEFRELTTRIRALAYDKVAEHDEIRLPMITLLMEHGAQINARDNDGWTALMWASWSGLTKTTEKLLDSGADISFEDKQGNNAMTIAAQRGNVGVVRSLLAKGANPLTATSTGKTARAAAEMGMAEYRTYEKDYVEILRLLDLR